MLEIRRFPPVPLPGTAVALSHLILTNIFLKTKYPVKITITTESYDHTGPFHPDVHVYTRM